MRCVHNSHLSFQTRRRTLISAPCIEPLLNRNTQLFKYIWVYSIKYIPLIGHLLISDKLWHWSLQIYIWEAHKYLCYLPPEAQLNPGWTQFWPLAVVARWCNWGSNHYSGLTLLPDTSPRVSLDPKNIGWTYEITVLQILIGELAFYEYRGSCFDRKKSLEHQWNLLCSSSKNHLMIKFILKIGDGVSHLIKIG